MHDTVFDPGRVLALRRKRILNKMRLYQHSARCPVALRAFLDCNPNYWCFIPQLSQDAAVDNARHSGAHPEDSRLMAYLERVPVPPAAYAFSSRQRDEQRAFFEWFIALPRRHPCVVALDLFKVAPIAVCKARDAADPSSLSMSALDVALVPDPCSSLLRLIIETFFIVHGETQLNMLCPIGGDPDRRYGRPYDLVWCKGLAQPSSTSTTTT
jgi:hypothetical protein